jgi:transposase
MDPWQSRPEVTWEGRPQHTARAAHRTVVERCINKLKQFRAVATRYDKREYIFHSTIDVASIRIWLCDPSHDPQDTA